MKTIQKIKGWGYPCDGKIFYWNDKELLQIDLKNTLAKTKIQLIRLTGCGCYCEKNCKPQKVYITVEVEC